MKKQNVNKVEETVECAVCGGVIGLRESKGTGLAWFDPYVKGVYYYKGHKGAYVHSICLTPKRVEEIKKGYEEDAKRYA